MTCLHLLKQKASKIRSIFRAQNCLNWDLLQSGGDISWTPTKEAAGFFLLFYFFMGEDAKCTILWIWSNDVGIPPLVLCHPFTLHSLELEPFRLSVILDSLLISKAHLFASFVRVLSVSFIFSFWDAAGRTAEWQTQCNGSINHISTAVGNYT